jgi:hypothetical protein
MVQIETVDFSSRDVVLLADRVGLAMARQYPPQQRLETHTYRHSHSQAVPYPQP